MDFDVKKNKILLFNNRGKFPRYSLHGHELEILGEVKYLGVTIQSDMTFTAYIQRKLMTANRQLGVIRRALYWAPTNVKLLAYNTLCLPHLEYTATAWDPSNKKDISDIEQLQDQAVRFIAGIKGRDGVEDAKTRTYLTTQKKERPAIETF